MRRHGASQTRLYRIWQGMKQRCNNPKHAAFHYYGGRGIKVCEEWQHNFTAFKEWAEAHGYSDTLTIDRIDNGKSYSPDNCRWVTTLENNHNRRAYSMSEEQKAYNIKCYKEWQNRKEKT